MPPTVEFIQEQTGHEAASCGIEIAEHSFPSARIFPCHKTAIVTCSDCGTEICKDHAIHCAACGEWFCILTECLGQSCIDDHKCSRVVAASVEAIAQVLR